MQDPNNTALASLSDASIMAAKQAIGGTVASFITGQDLTSDRRASLLAQNLLTQPGTVYFLQQHFLIPFFARIGSDSFIVQVQQFSVLPIHRSKRNLRPSCHSLHEIQVQQGTAN